MSTIRACMKPKTIPELIELTGLSQRQLAELLDIDHRSLSAIVNGRKFRHPAMLRRSLQLIVLEQRGIVTDELIEASAGRIE